MISYLYLESKEGELTRLQDEKIKLFDITRLNHRRFFRRFHERKKCDETKPQHSYMRILGISISFGT